jgi:gluconokinase
MVIVVMGVSGSGKTAVGKALAERLNWSFADADDFHSASNIRKMRQGIPLTEADRKPWLDSLSALVASWIAGKSNGVLACSALRRRYRDALRESDPAGRFVRFVYLQGSYEEIDRRVRLRLGHFMPQSLLESQFAVLEEPYPDEAMRVDIARPVAALVDLIVANLRLDPPSLAQ